MSNEITLRQKELIRKLANGSLREIDKNFLESGCTKQAADSWIKELIAEANNGDRAGGSLNKEYPIAFQAMVKAACELYKGTGKKFSEVVKEVKDSY